MSNAYIDGFRESIEKHGMLTAQEGRALVARIAELEKWHTEDLEHIDVLRTRAVSEQVCPDCERVSAEWKEASRQYRVTRLRADELEVLLSDRNAELEQAVLVGNAHMEDAAGNDAELGKARARIAELEQDNREWKGVVLALNPEVEHLRARIAEIEGDRVRLLDQADRQGARITELEALLADTQSDLEAEVADDYRIGDELSRLNEYKARIATLEAKLRETQELLATIGLSIAGDGTPTKLRQACRVVYLTIDAALARRAPEEPRGE